MERVAIVILAAGMGKRMKSSLPKVLHPIGGIPLVSHVIKLARSLRPEKIVLVLGHGREQVQAACSNEAGLRFAVQSEQKGTGDAVKSALPLLDGFSGTVIILSGDVPLTRTDTLGALLSLHTKKNSTISLLSFSVSGEEAYGRVVRDKAGNVIKIVEKKDSNSEELKINEFNASIYAVDSAFLTPAIESLEPKNAQGEYYLTDIVEKASKEGQTVHALKIEDSTEVLGVNNPWELLMLDRELTRRKIEALALDGVKFVDPDTVYLDADVIIEAGVKIGPSVTLRGKTVIHSGAELEGNALLIDTEVASGALVKFGVRAEAAKIGTNTMVGPFAHLRPGTVLGAEVKVGNFVETKNTTMAAGAKASHLTYLGDATVGADANIGAGTITCNYDGVNKNKTEIGAGAFIGSNSSLVAPVKIGDAAYVGAGSVITKDVSAKSLAFTRSPQLEKKNWSGKKKT